MKLIQILGGGEPRRIGLLRFVGAFEVLFIFLLREGHWHMQGIAEIKRGLRRQPISAAREWRE